MITRAGAITRDSGLVVDCGVGVVESATVTFTVNVPLTAGTPAMAPVVELIFRPVGRPPADQVSGAFPPVAETVVLYERLIAPLGNDVERIVSPVATVNENCLVTL